MLRSNGLENNTSGQWDVVARKTKDNAPFVVVFPLRGGRILVGGVNTMDIKDTAN